MNKHDPELPSTGDDDLDKFMADERVRQDKLWSEAQAALKDLRFYEFDLNEETNP